MTISVTNLNVVAGDQKLTLTWGVSDTTGLAAFLIHWQVAGAVSWNTIEVDSNTRSYVLGSLQNGVKYRTQVRALVAGGIASFTSTPTSPPIPSQKPIIGIVNGTGWGTTATSVLRNAGISSARDEGVTAFKTNVAAGYTNCVALLGNTVDSTPLSQVDIVTWLQNTIVEIDQVPAGTLIEVCNEVYLKGGVADPIKYAQMFSSLATLRPNVTLLFNSFGDYKRSDGSWSQVSQGNGWLADALAAVPALKSQIKGFTNHPYGTVNPLQNNANDWGPGALVAQYNQAVKLGFANADKWYLTEYGVNIHDVGTQQAQADQVIQAFNFFLGLPYVRGIWYFQTRDYGTNNNWGVLNDDNTPRPSLTALSNFAR